VSDLQLLIVATLVKTVVIFLLCVHVVPVMVILERRISAWIQLRIGPNRVGPLGLFQPLADLVKFLGKEDFVPPGASKFLFWLAPALTALPPFLVMANIPFGPAFEIRDGVTIQTSILDSSVGLLMVLALSSLTVFGLAIGGWSSNSKYSLLGGLRSSAQMISYELALGISALAVVCVAGTLNLQELIARQTAFVGFDEATGNWRGWNVFAQPLAFLLFVIAGFAETNRTPFDLPEAESELVGGYHTEYSATKFALFFMGEYTGMLGISCLTVILFLGGWHVPGMSLLADPGTVTYFLIGFGAFLAKVSVFLFLFIQVRWTLPRFRYDQLMSLGWKLMLPIALLNLLLTGAVVAGT
jgi:NADH-quinone oxidoreductase subunit H